MSNTRAQAQAQSHEQRGGRGAHTLIIGTGVAGLSATLAAVSAGAHVTLVSESEDLSFGGNTALAQGGIAAAIGAGDTPEQHAQDTLTAGAGLVDEVAARVLTADGAYAVRELIAGGWAVDRDTSGAPKLGLEGAHGVPRIVHAGEDRSGASLHAFLVNRLTPLLATGHVTLLAKHRAVALITASGAVTGAVLEHLDGGSAATTPNPHITISADAVVVATGGYAGLFPRNTNSHGPRGNGTLLAASAGALLTDLEFVQFHPTVIHGTHSLISEAVRGAGAVLRDSAGRRFMQGAHPLAELAPRDVVAREIHRVIQEAGASTAGAAAAGAGPTQQAAVWIDATPIERSSPGALARRFPAISAAIRAHGFDWSRDPVPVSPAAHYTMGGIVTDLHGRTTVPGLFAAGEAASTGVHGANRLASNSLLEGLVFGQRAGRAASQLQGDFAAHESFTASLQLHDTLDVTLPDTSPAHPSGPPITDSAAHADEVRDTTDATHVNTVSEAIAHGLGVEREEAGLRSLIASCSAAASLPSAQLATLIASAANARTESRGSHQRSDYPATDPTQERRLLVRALMRQVNDDSSLTTREGIPHAYAPAH